MSLKTKTANGPKSTMIQCTAPHAKAVFVAGEFNDWSPSATPLQRDAAGHWSASLNLPPGHHEYKFVVDGQWCCEPGCEGPHHGCPKCVTNDQGTMNRALEVA